MIIVSHAFPPNADISTVKTMVLLWAFENLDNTKVYNKHFDDYIEFNKKGIKKTIHSKVKALFNNETEHKHFFYSITALREIVEKAVYKAKEKHKHGDQNIMVHIFESQCMIDTQIYDIGIVVREVVVDKKREIHKRFFYSHSFPIKKPDK